MILYYGPHGLAKITRQVLVETIAAASFDATVAHAKENDKPLPGYEWENATATAKAFGRFVAGQIVDALVAKDILIEDLS